MTNQDDSYGAAQQSQPVEITTQVQKLIKEETKEPEPAGGAAMSTASVDAHPEVNQ